MEEDFVMFIYRFISLARSLFFWYNQVLIIHDSTFKYYASLQIWLLKRSVNSKNIKRTFFKCNANYAAMNEL